MDAAIKFRHIRPYSPHLNGKAERSQRTNRVEFYATVERSDPHYKQPEDVLGENGLLKKFTKALLERAMEVEMVEHLGRQKARRGW